MLPGGWTEPVEFSFESVDDAGIAIVRPELPYPSTPEAWLGLKGTYPAGVPGEILGDPSGIPSERNLLGESP